MWTSVSRLHFRQGGFCALGWGIGLGRLQRSVSDEQAAHGGLDATCMRHQCMYLAVLLTERIERGDIIFYTQ